MSADDGTASPIESVDDLRARGLSEADRRSLVTAFNSEEPAPAPFDRAVAVTFALVVAAFVLAPIGIAIAVRSLPGFLLATFVAIAYFKASFRTKSLVERFRNARG